MSDYVQSYATLATSLMERWSSLASKTASRMDTRSYDAASAARDTAR